MKNMKRLVAIVAAVGVIGTASTAFALTSKTPADIAAGLTGKTAEELYKERAEGKTFGAIAKDAGKLEEFKQQMLEQKKAVLDQRVKDGQLSREQADEIYNAIKSNQANCDGTGSAAIGRKYGACFGQGSGMGNGQGAGRDAQMHNSGGMGRRCGWSKKEVRE